MFEIYAILDPRLPGIYDYGIVTLYHEPFYIGKGNIQQRRKYKRKNKYAEGRIRNIREAGLEPIYLTLSTYTDEKEAFAEEKTFIHKIGRIDEQCGSLFNFTDGGEGTSGIKISRRLIELRRKNTTKFWSSLTEQERKLIGQKSLQNRNKENVLKGGKQASITKANKPIHVKKDIEKRRYAKWCERMYNRTEEQNKIRSLRCSLASKKQSIVFLKLEICKSNNNELVKGNVYEKSVAEWRQLGIPRDVATTLWKTNNTSKIATTRVGIRYRVISGAYKSPICTKML